MIVLFYCTVHLVMVMISSSITFIKFHANVNAIFGKDELRSLHRACCFGHTNVVKILLEHGSSVNIFNKHGETPLHSALSMGHCGIIKILFLNGAYLKLNDYKKGTASQSQ